MVATSGDARRSAASIDMVTPGPTPIEVEGCVLIPTRQSLTHYRGKPFVVREWRVELSGRVIGTVHRDLVTREVKSKGNRYVSRCWQSPGWLWSDGGYSFEASSRVEAVRILVREARRASR